ncbi:MAG: substrate-binding domain-containing protein, partial [Spirochaetales bacterium]|nr:substrate-binding domain-containing protein [Spirochaetales bacterium]
MPEKLYNGIRPKIGLLIDIIYENYQAKVWEGVVEGAKQLGVDLINFAGCSLRAPYGYRIQRNIVYDLVNEESVDGLILTGSLGSYIGEEEFKQFYERFSPLPMVSISTHIPHIPSVLVDNVKGMEQCVNHLIKKHHCRNFAFIRGPQGNPEAELRYTVFKDVLSENNISLLPELILDGDFYKDSGAQGVSTLLDKRKTPFDVIIAANDVMAIDALEELQRRDIKVPEDVLVVGFDDIEGSRYTRPPLATVHQPL